jgi:hypothetical protein
MELAGRPDLLRCKRPQSEIVIIQNSAVSMRDQKPLHRGNISFDRGWNFEDVIQMLNERVFFWPGTEGGPISYGLRHFERYAGEKPVILRILSQDMFDKNEDQEPQFCPYNSGSPRCSNGLGSPRGPKTFVTCEVAEFTASKVVEVTYVLKALLPRKVEISDCPQGPWRPL